MYSQSARKKALEMLALTGDFEKSARMSGISGRTLRRGVARGGLFYRRKIANRCNRFPMAHCRWAGASSMYRRIVFNGAYCKVAKSRRRPP